MPIRAVATRGRRVIPLAVTRNRGDSIPAPVGGWNARDSLADMAEADATILDNWFPRTSDVKVRAGSANHVTGITGVVESVMSWTGPSASKLFGAAGASVYNVTAAGAVGAADFTGMTSARWQHVNFGTSAGAFLYLVNGFDAPRYYDGSSWTVPVITGAGLTASNLVNLAIHKRRLFFCENNKLGFWYFPVETISGAISYFDLAPLCSLGGYLVAIGSWTRDGGAGMDDFAVFITSNGEAIVYQGTNPADVAAWALVGVFRLGPPIGRRCFVKLGADLIVITQDGFAPLSLFLASGRSSQRAAVSDKIRGAVNEAITNNRSKFGWQPIVYPRGNMILFNIPMVENVEAHQYVSNTTTGAWCRFKGWNSSCWELLNDDIYFGTSGKVMKADTGLSDAGADISTDAQTAFSYLGHRGQLKKFNMARPLLATDGNINVALEAMVEYETHVPTATPTFTAPTGTSWDEGVWDVAPWSDFEQLVKNWQTIGGLGYAVALRMRTVSNGGNLRWFSNDVLWEPGSFV